MKIVCLIPARGGSKGVPAKNIKLFAGKPLIIHTIHHALGTPQVQQVYVSTDDEKIARISENAGARIIHRPAELAGDLATTESAIRHFLDTLESLGDPPDIIVLMQATSPYRPENSLKNALDHFIQGKFDSLVTISPTHHFFWHLNGDIAVAEYDFMNRPMRQEMKPEDIRYVENGSYYIFTTSHFRKSGNRLGGRIGYMILPEIYGHQIDTETDFALIERIFLENNGK